MNEEYLALKPYLDSVEEICGRLPQEKLTGIILGLAQTVPVRERRSYLQRVESLAENRSIGTWDEGVLGRIETLQADIGKRLAALQDGSFYEDGPIEGGQWDSDEEMPSALSEEQMHELEALFLGRGPEALASRVRRWGGRQPRAWLFWIRLLALAEDWNAAAAAAEQALAAVDHGYFRVQIAERLVEAGGKINRPDRVLTGLWEVFCSLPGEKALLRLLEEAERQNRRAEELERALDFVRSLPADHPSLLAKILLMVGKVREAFESNRDTPALGWSFSQNAGAVVFAGILALLCSSRIAEAATVRRLLRRHADSFDAPPDFLEEPDSKPEAPGGNEPRTRISEEILTGLRCTSSSPKELQQYRLWAMGIGRGRVEQIVGAKHRGAYDRAAEVLGALAECSLLNGNEEGGRDLIDEYRNRRFNRYPAFRRELDRVLASSSILRRSLRIGDG